jgi:hypothetical protein
MKALRTLKEVLLSSLPLLAIIVIVCVLIAPMEHPSDYGKLALGFVCVIVGQAFFLVGLDESILPAGKLIGSSLPKLKKSIFVILFGVLFGILATVAEPALAVLARQAHYILNEVDATLFIWILSTGIGMFVGLALYRVIKNFSIKVIFALLYGLIFLVVIFVPEEFVALAFDGSGATTGDISVPFILALGIGISATMSKRKTNEDTFGIIGIASVGPILAVFLYGILLKVVYGGEIPPAAAYSPGGTGTFLSVVIENLGGVALALLPILLVFLAFQLFFLRLPKKQFIRMMLGAIPVYAGLLIFLSGIDFGFAFAGKYIGEVFLDAARPEWFAWLLVPLGFVLGVAITLSEPAVTVLGEQLEEITNGHIRKASIRWTLALGIGLSGMLIMVKILTQVNILWFLVPLYAVSLLMMPFTTDLFVGLAFDSGGVTGGALTSAFLTPLTLGAAQAVAKKTGFAAQSVLTNGFGIIAFISVTPLITVQALGILYTRQMRLAKERQDAYEALEYEELTSLAAHIVDEDETASEQDNSLTHEPLLAAEPQESGQPNPTEPNTQDPAQAQEAPAQLEEMTR